MRARSMLLSLFLLSGAALWADTTTTVPGHFTIDLNSPVGCTQDSTDCTDNWIVPNQTVTFTLQFNQDVSQADFQPNFTAPFPPNPCGEVCLTSPLTNSCGAACTDPSMEMDAGGASTPILANGQIFTLDDATCPRGICDFQNDTNVDWFNVLISVANNYGGQPFDCRTDETGHVFDDCGFRAVDGGATIEALFSGTTNSPGIPTTVPEPSTLALVLSGFGMSAAFARRNASRHRS